MKPVLVMAGVIFCIGIRKDISILQHTLPHTATTVRTHLLLSAIILMVARGGDTAVKTGVPPLLRASYVFRVRSAISVVAMYQWLRLLNCQENHGL